VTSESDPSNPDQVAEATEQTAGAPPALANIAQEPVSPPEPPVLHTSRAEPFLFHGRAGEYFRIWVVNTLLTILTLGVFAAWAKVRKRRYLRGSTELLGHRFDYRANPYRLLIGNAIVVTLFLAYSIFGAVYPAVRIGAIAVAGLLLPWIVVRSLAFNAHNTAYRGLRFRFHPPLSPAVMVYFLKPILIVLTLGLYYPAWVRARKEYTITYHRFGSAYFHFNGGRGPFYVAYLLSGLLVVLAAGGGATLMTLLNKGPQHATPGLLQLLPFLVIYGLALFVAKHYIHAKLFNHVWNHTRLDEHRFQAQMGLGRWLGIQFTNMGAVIATCGLLYPWAVVRSLRYTASCITLTPDGSIDGIEKLGSSEGSAVGDTAAEFFGLDFGL
jgi:uncharacterized membrane protein YjgN (DUF898 family)